MVGIAALIAGIVWAYRNVEGFRKVADAAFRAIGKAVGWLVDKAVAGFKLLWAGVEKVGGWFKKLTGGADDAADATEVFQALAVMPTERRLGTMTPWPPKAATLRMIAPRLRGSVIPSRATTRGMPGASGSMRSPGWAYS